MRSSHSKTKTKTEQATGPGRRHRFLRLSMKWEMKVIESKIQRRIR